MILLTFTLSESGLHSSMPLGVKYLLWNTIENSRNVYMIIKIKHSHFIRILNNAHVSFPPFFYSAYQPASLSFAFIAILLKIKKKFKLLSFFPLLLHVQMKLRVKRGYLYSSMKNWEKAIKYLLTNVNVSNVQLTWKKNTRFNQKHLKSIFVLNNKITGHFLLLHNTRLRLADQF